MASAHDPDTMDDLRTAVRLGVIEARLESLDSNLSDLKIEHRATNSRLDGITLRLDGCATRVDLSETRTDLRQLRSKVDYLLYWMIGSQAALLVVMAHGFKWI